MRGRRLLYLVNDPEFFVTHRLPVAREASAAGFDVHVATAPGAQAQCIASFGLQHHAIPISRGGLNPLKELVTFGCVLELLRRLKPDLLHVVTIKPLLYGCIAARLMRVPGVVAAVSGLGYLFDATRLRPRLINVLLQPLYPLAFGHPNLRVIFQNEHDRTALEARGLAHGRTVLIRGSGVDLNAYRAEPEPSGTPVVTFAARLLRSKGIETFVEAASILRSRGITAEFRVLGDPDPANPDSIPEAEVIGWSASGLIVALGKRADIPRQFAQSHIVVLPSHYREGLPKVLLEAAACGRPVITTDHPGCRDAIRPGATGLLVPTRDAPALADAIARLLLDADLRKRMGLAARQLAEAEFDVSKVVSAHIELYRQLAEGVSRRCPKGALQHDASC